MVLLSRAQCLPSKLSQARLHAKLHGRNSCHFLVDTEAPPTREKEGRTGYEHFPIKGRYAAFLLAGIGAELPCRMCSVGVNVPSYSGWRGRAPAPREPLAAHGQARVHLGCPAFYALVPRTVRSKLTACKALKSLTTASSLRVTVPSSNIPILGFNPCVTKSTLAKCGISSSPKKRARTL